MSKTSVLAVGVIMAGLLPFSVQAGAVGDIAKSATDNALSVEQRTGASNDTERSSTKATRRPCSDFLKAQGKLNKPPQFFPPVRDYVGWTDNPFETFGLVDYAGLADKFIKRKTGESLGTEVKCLVIQRKLDDGSATIDVSSFTARALGFAQSAADLIANNFDLLNTPTNFGAKAQDVVKGAKPAVGPAALNVSFRIAKPGAPLPDLLAVTNSPCTYAPVSLRFVSYTFGTVPSGADAVLQIREAAAVSQDACAKDPKAGLTFTEEVVEILGGGE
ncbi:MAG: hypothetical protein U1E42_15375 [Rhodospirillales bacterium]